MGSLGLTEQLGYDAVTGSFKQKFNLLYAIFLDQFDVTWYLLISF